MGVPAEDDNVTLFAGRAVTVDNAAPIVAIISPASGSSVSLCATIQASAGDNFGVLQVVLYDGTTVIGTDTTAFYSVLERALLISKGRNAAGRFFNATFHLAPPDRPTCRHEPAGLALADSLR